MIQNENSMVILKEFASLEFFPKDDQNQNLHSVAKNIKTSTQIRFISIDRFILVVQFFRGTT